ncbi:MAG TPA: hypothetical protein VG269_13480 [Tepidisphaeraceae bacterium]|jgi:hypothetical protein|nr:hypothetical protein [Tepidisphaeraceae bacterium]
MKISQIVAALLTLGLFAGLSPARASTTLTVECGWGDRVKADRWVPLFITASDSGPRPRNVVIDIHWPHGGQYAMHIRQFGAIGPEPRTFPLLVPIRGWAYQEASVTLFDDETGKTLAHFPENPDSASFAQPYFNPNGSLIGISGRLATLDALQGIGGAGQILTTGFLDPARLPDSALGYDSLAALVLNGPNLVRSGVGPTALSETQQQAIVDWVRGGGTVILWPGDGGFPSRSPLADVLPARLGERINLDLTPEERAAAGLPPRFARMAVHQLVPDPGAQKIPLLGNGQVAAYSKRVGLGRIVLAPLNVGDLQFDDNSKVTALWQPLLGTAVSLAPTTAEIAGMPPPTTLPGVKGSMNGYVMPVPNDEQQENTAAMSIADFLGNVPGAGEFGFGYIAFALIAMMVIVGPVDWFVLKKLGRQPWTWVTTGGWIALVTLGAVYAGHLFKSGDLHYRTLRVIEQADNATIATTDFVGLYSPRSTRYDVAPPDGESWWQPAGVEASGRSSGLKLDVDFAQTQKGNLPGAMFVNVWSLRFLRGDTLAADLPAIIADLRLDPAPGGAWRVVGTFKNLTDQPLKNVRIVTANVIAACTFTPEASSATAPATMPAAISEIPAHATMHVVATPLPTSAAPAAAAPHYPNFYGYNAPPDEANLWSVASQINRQRVRKIDALVATGEFVVVTAESVGPPPAAILKGDHHPIERHWQFIRALVALQKSAEAPAQTRP